MAAGLIAVVMAGAPLPAAAAAGDGARKADARERGLAATGERRKLERRRMARVHAGRDEDDDDRPRRYQAGDDRPRITKRRQVRHARHVRRHQHASRRVQHASRRALRRSAQRAPRKAVRAQQRRHVEQRRGVAAGSATHGVASYYYQGRVVASGARFNPDGLTAAHRSLPFGTRLRVTHMGNGRSVDVVVNDRGPFIGGRVIDLSRGAARVIGMIGQGLARVSFTILGR
jgi:rare lipoprotein A